MRKGISKQPIIRIKGNITSNEFAFCVMTINSKRKIKVVSNLSHEQLIRKAQRFEAIVKTIDVEIIKKYDKIIY